jgi:hypothetical protein
MRELYARCVLIMRCDVGLRARMCTVGRASAPVSSDVRALLLLLLRRRKPKSRSSRVVANGGFTTDLFPVDLLSH